MAKTKLSKQHQKLIVDIKLVVCINELSYTLRDYRSYLFETTNCALAKCYRINSFQNQISKLLTEILQIKKESKC